MAAIRVTVEGPGGSLGAPMLAIKEALTSLGCIVRVEDQHPMPEQTARDIIDNGVFINTHIVLEAKHDVWGG